MVATLLGALSGADGEASLIERLDALPFDEMAEVDVAGNMIQNIYHVAGKYFVPVATGSYRDLYRYCNEYMVHPDDRGIHEALMDPETVLERLEAADPPGALSARFRYKLQDGGWRWVEQVVVGGASHGLPEGKTRFYVFDIQTSKDREVGSVTDGLYVPSKDRDERTGLYRAKAFFAKASQLLEGSRDGEWVIIALDVLHFRLFNDWNGREAGDFLLSRIGSHLFQVAKRVGGLAGYFELDDFCLLAPADSMDVEALYYEIALIVSEAGRSGAFAPAFGVSRFVSGTAVLDLYDQAMLAQANGKIDYREPICYYDPSMQRESEDETRLLFDFKEAIENNEIVYYLQPQCRTFDGKVVGVEVLARWIKPDGTMVPPFDFVPVLEKYRFITDLDCHIWNLLCVDLKRWIESGNKPVPASINISQVDFYVIDVADYLERLTEKYDIPRNLLKVEITESAYADDALEVRETVQRLRDMGFMVLMDDFGSGYSSLNMLSSLNVDVVKLDAGFFRTEGDERKRIHIVESVINMAKTMDLPIICEGVETREQAEFLEGLGCRYIQGYVYYRPMPVADFEKLIADGQLVDDRGFVTKPNDEFRIREFLDRNVYSDSMLNSILGAVVIYERRGDQVNIVRFNENFYEMAQDPQVTDHLKDVQSIVAPSDAERFYAMFDTAVNDHLNGANAILGFINVFDETIRHFLIHCYFIEDKGEDGQLFYASLRDVSPLMRLQNEIALFSRVAEGSIVFLKKRKGHLVYQVVIHGLQDAIGLDSEEFEAELTDKRFYRRVDAASAAEILDTTKRTDGTNESYTHDFILTNARGEQVPMRVRSDCVDSELGVRHILTFRLA